MPWQCACISTTATHGLMLYDNFVGMQVLLSLRSLSCTQVYKLICPLTDMEKEKALVKADIRKGPSEMETGHLPHHEEVKKMNLLMLHTMASSWGYMTL